MGPSSEDAHRTERPEKAQRNILILGSGRSGTSLLAGLFAKSGYFMGENLYPPRESNPKGFFESPELNSINEEILSACVRRRLKIGSHELFRSRPLHGHSWLARVGLNPRLTTNAAVEERIRRIVSRAPYCLKDPRFSYTLPVWRPWLRNTVFLCIFREPEVTAASMVKEVRVVRETEGYRNYINFRQALSVWTCMYRHILETHRREGNWLFVHYQQVLNAEALDSIEAFTNVSLDRSFPDAHFDRSRASGNVPSARARGIYAALCSLAGYCHAERNDRGARAGHRLTVSGPATGADIHTESAALGPETSKLQLTEAIPSDQGGGETSPPRPGAIHRDEGRRSAIRVTGIVLTRNGAKRLPYCLPGLRQIVDELIVQIDDSSTDDSESVARSYTDRVMRVTHRGPVENQLRAMVDACDGDWVFRLDDDEVLSGFSRDPLQQLLSCRRLTHVWVPRRWLVNQGNEFIETAPWFPDFQMRLFRNLPSLISFPTGIHEPMTMAGVAGFLAWGSIDHMDLIWNDRACREAKVRFYQQLRPEKPCSEVYLYENLAYETSPLKPAPKPAGEEEAATSSSRWFVRILDCPNRMKSGLGCVARLRIRNASDAQLLPASNLIESPNARICYHWLSESQTGLETVIWEAERSPLPVPLAPGDTADALVPVTPPATPGRFVLQFDLVDDYQRKFWFSLAYPDADWPKQPVDVT